MEVQQYLERMSYHGPVRVCLDTLHALHEQHVKTVPFENLDIHYKHPFTLEIEKVFHKVVVAGRGGFCYELNYLFNQLLIAMGFQSRIIAARIFKDTGELGPERDHMSVHVTLDHKDYLLDVGFGDLFMTPLEINTTDAQFDGRCRFKISGVEANLFELSMARYPTTFERKYVFEMADVNIGAFEPLCVLKQSSPESYFVQNTICTRATDEGRITIFNNKLIERNGNIRKEWHIASDTELRAHLKEKFFMVL